MENLNSEVILAFVMQYLPRVVGFLLLLVVGYAVAGWVRRLVNRNLTRAEFDPTLTKFFSGTARMLVLLVVVIAALGMFGVQTASFAAILGAAGLAIGLALQGTLGNFAAGVMLLVFRPYKVGDVVTVSGQTGVVDEIDLFVTKLDTFDNRRVIVPNGEIFGSTIVNITHHDTRRVDIQVGTDYGADLAHVRAVLEQVPGRIEGALETPAPQIYLSDLGDSSIHWQVRIWCTTPDYGNVWQQTTHEVKRALDDAGIGIPYPQMDVHLDQLDQAA